MRALQRTAHRYLPALASAALVFWSPACKSSKPREDSKPAAKAQGTESPAAAKGPQPGGHLRLPSAEPRYLNPVLQTQFDRASDLVFEGLVGLGVRLEPVPCLASRWDLSADGKTLTFNLLPDVEWHDGRPFTSKDVAFTFQAIREAGVATLWKAYMASVDTVETPDDHTVVVKYKEPYGPALVSWTVGILPAHLYGEGELAQSKYNREAVGTGPYKVARWEPGQRMVLQANRDWWYHEGDKKLPYIDSIELVFTIPVKDALDALEKGDIDFTEIIDVDLWVNRVQSAELREEFEVSDVAEAQFRVIAWNTQKPHLSDQRVRQALAYSLNRSRVIDDVLYRSAQPISAPFFPTMYGADPSIAPWPFDLDKAVKLLDEAGHPARSGSPRFAIEMIALESQEHPVTHATMGIFRNDLRAIGVELTLTYLPTAEFFDRLVAGKYDAVYFGWIPDIPDPDPYGLLHTSMIGSGSNYARYANPEVDKLLENARATTNADERKALYHQLHRILSDGQPYTVLYAPMGHYVWSRRLRGVNPSDVGGQPRFPGLAHWWISPNTPVVAPGKPDEP